MAIPPKRRQEGQQLEAHVRQKADVVVDLGVFQLQVWERVSWLRSTRIACHLVLEDSARNAHQHLSFVQFGILIILQSGTARAYA